MSENKQRDEAYNLRKIFEEMELDLVRSLRRNLKRHETEEEKEGFRWEMWQKAKLRNLQKYRKENTKIVDKISPEVERLVNDALDENYHRGQKLFNRIWNKIKSAFFKRRRVQFPENIVRHKLSTQPPPENDFFGVNDQKLRVMQETVSHDLKKAQHAVLRRMDDVYRKTVYNTQIQLAAGAKTLDQAIDLATKQFLEKGIDCIEYKNGNRVNIASYAEMALRTASHRAMLLGEGKKRDEWGIHTVVVSAHANTCQLCAPWQGKVLVDDVYCQGTKEEALQLNYPLLSDAIKSGLLHPNCRHTISTYFPGITKIPEVPDRDKTIETYQAEQKQRSLERKIRKWKRKAEGCLDSENISYANDKVREYQKELREHLEKHTELRREYGREKTRGVITTGHPASKYGFENFDKEHLANDVSELLPNLKNADIPDAKITGYALNKNHPKGKDKAIAFEKSLGYNISNKDELLREVLEGLEKYKCSKRAETQYGVPYEVAMIIKGANGKFAKVKTGWIIDHGAEVPRLTTIYVDD